jgi:hypothetical protein
MTSTHKVPKKITAILAIIFILPALYIHGVWINVSGHDITQAEKAEEFTGYFPSFLHDPGIITYISMSFCVIAMIFAAKSFKQPLLLLRIAMWLIVMIASLIFFLDIFQLL